MIVDKELDELEIKLSEKKFAKEENETSLQQSDFSKKMDVVQQKVLVEASSEDKEFVKTVVKNVKEAAVAYTEVEQKKAELEKQNVEYESEKLDTQQQANANKQLEDRWINRQKRREYHYNGVKPIMTFVGITEPMNLLFLYFFAIILIIPFLLNKFLRGTIGALLAGAEDENRSKTAKGFIWTFCGVILVLATCCCIYLFLKWQGIDILEHIKS